MRIIRFITNNLSHLPRDRVLLSLLERLPRINRAVDNSESTHLILVECVEDIYFLGIFSSCISGLSKRVPLRCEFFVPRSINAALGINLKSWVLRSFLCSGWIARQWIRVYKQLMQGIVGYRSVSWGSLWIDSRALVDAWSIWRRQVDLGQLESLKAEGVEVGDLLIDTYLRFRPAATVRLNDPFLLYVIWQTLRDARRGDRYFSIQKPKLYLTSYATYIQHGIAARLALKHGTPVMCFGNLQQLGKCLKLTDHFQTKNPTSYLVDFLKLKTPQLVIEEARKQLEIRLNGGVDDATVYMTTSAYSNKSVQTDLAVAGAVIVFLHDFFDSPHIYANLVFPDFWTWACFTLETLALTGKPFAVKPHPNQTAASAAVIERLRKSYPEVNFISSNISNSNLVAGGMRAAVSMHGTIIHELAYLGVPSIGCSQHPHVAFDFCKTARNRKEYFELLQDAHTMRFTNIENVQNQVLMFYAMHNLSGDKVEQSARAALVEYWKSCSAEICNYTNIDTRLSDLNTSEGFFRLIDRLEQLLVCGCDITEE